MIDTEDTHPRRSQHQIQILLPMSAINSVAWFERDLANKRTQAGMARGRTRNKIKSGETISAIAREMKASRQTILRERDRG